MDFKWKIKFIWSTIQVGKNNTDQRSFVVEEVGKEYPSSIAIDMRKEKCMELNSYEVGDEVELSLNSTAREYNGKYFNSISAWKIKNLSKVKQDKKEMKEAEEKDDLPF